MVTATGNTSVQFDELIDLLANCAAFQTWVGAGSAAAAKNSVYIEGFLSGGDMAGKRPFALFGILNFESESYATGSSKAFSQMRDYSLMFEIDVTDGDDHKDAAYRFFNAIDDIVDEIMDLADTDKPTSGVYINIDRLSHDGPFRSNERDGDADGDYIAIDFRLSVGFPTTSSGGGGEV